MQATNEDKALEILRLSRGVNHEESKPGETVTAGPAATAAPAKQVNQNLSPEEWKAATDYALNLSDKMRASEQRSEETKSRQQKRGHHNE